jgi:hypothetical protein
LASPGRGRLFFLAAGPARRSLYCRRTRKQACLIADSTHSWQLTVPAARNHELPRNSPCLNPIGERGISLPGSLCRYSPEVPSLKPSPGRGEGQEVSCGA